MFDNDFRAVIETAIKEDVISVFTPYAWGEAGYSLNQMLDDLVSTAYSHRHYNKAGEVAVYKAVREYREMLNA